MWMSVRLSRQAEPVLQQLHDVHRPGRCARGGASRKPRLAPLLAGDLNAGAIEVSDEAQRSVAHSLPMRCSSPVRHSCKRSSASACAHRPGAGRLPGRVEVVGHTDDQAVESLRFPSNWHLSRERAQAVAAALAEAGHAVRAGARRGPRRDRAACAQRHPAGRARNRRVEVQLLLPRPESWKC